MLNSIPAHHCKGPLFLTVVSATVWLFDFYLDHWNHEVFVLCHPHTQLYILFSYSWWWRIHCGLHHSSHHWFFPLLQSQCWYVTSHNYLWFHIVYHCRSQWQIYLLLSLPWRIPSQPCGFLMQSKNESIHCNHEMVACGEGSFNGSDLSCWNPKETTSVHGTQAVCYVRVVWVSFHPSHR